MWSTRAKEIGACHEDESETHDGSEKGNLFGFVVSCELGDFVFDRVDLWGHHGLVSA